MKRGEFWIVGFMILAVFAVAGLFILSAIRYAAKPQWTETVIMNPGSKTGDRFGFSVDVSLSGTVVIGAPGEDGIGAVHIYDRDGSEWNITRIAGTNKGAESGFGAKVAVSDDGNTVLTAWESNSSRVLLYHRSGEGWSAQSLSPISIQSDDRFGSALAISSNGSVYAVGSMSGDWSAQDAGAVYVYREGASAVQLTASDAGRNTYFGEAASLAPDGNRLIAGCPWDDKNGMRSGSIYLYEWTSGSITEANVVPEQAGDQMSFGLSVGLAGNRDRIIVGAPWDSEKASLAGALFVYTRRNTDWKEDKLFSRDGAEGDWFGFVADVSDDGELIVCGAPYNDQYGSECGAAYWIYYSAGKWLQTRIVPDHAVGGSLFGYSTALSGDGHYAVVGAPGGLGGQIGSGRVYFYELE